MRFIYNNNKYTKSKQDRHLNNKTFTFAKWIIIIIFIHELFLLNKGYVGIKI